jgi:O-antigen/teichoic acid export membrane protein
VFSTVADQPAKLVGALRLSLRVALFVFVPCMVGIAVVARPLIMMVYGQRWMPAAPLLSILAVSATFWPLHVLNLAAIGARGRSDLIFRLEVVKRVVSIGLILACSPYGPIAIAWAVLATGLFGVLVNTWYSKRLLGYGVLAQLQDQSSTLLLSAIAAGVAWLASHWLARPPVALAAAVVAAMAAYFGGAALGKVAAWRDLLALLHTLRSRNATGTTPTGSDA